jgi:hypothetical protein
MPRSITALACLLALGSTQAQTADLVRGEYWIDQDLGIGANTMFALSNTSQVPGLQLPISMAGYGPGVHTIGLRTLDADGLWSLTNFTTAVVIEPLPAPPAGLVETEYFLNEDPGFGNGLSAWSGNDTDTAGVQINPDLSDAVTGVNTLFFRSRTSDGVWSLTNHRPVLVIEPEEATEIVQVETFALPGPDPGFGSGDQHSVISPAIDLSAYVFDAPLVSGTDLYDTVMVRSRDASGRWSLTNRVIIDGSTAVEDLGAAAGIAVFPNPFTDAFTVRTADAQPVRVIVYDAQGKLVHDQLVNGKDRVDLSAHSSGTYTVFFWKEADRIHRVQLVKQ